jgi:hypothetical protein
LIDNYLILDVRANASFAKIHYAVATPLIDHIQVHQPKLLQATTARKHRKDNSGRKTAKDNSDGWKKDGQRNKSCIIGMVRATPRSQITLYSVRTDMVRGHAKVPNHVVLD